MSSWTRSLDELDETWYGAVGKTGGADSHMSGIPEWQGGLGSRFGGVQARRVVISACLLGWLIFASTPRCRVGVGAFWAALAFRPNDDDQ